MRRPSWANGPALIIAAVLVVAVAVAFVVVSTSGGTSGPTKPPAGVASDVTTKIPAADGVSLSAEVITPVGRGPFPLVVMPGSWGSSAQEYRLPGLMFAGEGYQVVSYAQRGFPGSGGTIDLAGPKTRADVSTVIDWALGHTRADRAHIGLLGISYGAGISLLAAARDSRIKAVVAMSGWTDLAAALAPEGTPNVQAMHLLLDSRQQAGSLTGQTRQLADSLSGDAAGTASILESLTASRSADTEVAALNKNRPAIMLANAYQDSVLDPADVVPFFDQLTTPKRLQFAPGDHGGPEAAGLQGKPDQTFTDAMRWLDHYLRGAANGIDRADPVQLMDDVTGKWHGYRAWPTTSSTVQLGAPDTGDIVASGAPPWTRRLTAGTDSGAASGPLFTQQPIPFHPPQISMSSVNPKQAYLWNAPAVTKPTVMSGSPTVRLDVSSSSPSTTLYAYLYDVGADGSATLMTYAPDTTKSGTTTITLHPLSWTVAAGHHVALVVDTVDERYMSAAPSGSTVTLSSSAADPATLSVPAG